MKYYLVIPRRAIIGDMYVFDTLREAQDHCQKNLLSDDGAFIAEVIETVIVETNPTLVSREPKKEDFDENY